MKLAEGGALSGSIGRIKAVLAIPPLLRGQIRITEAQLQSGRLMLTPRAGAPVGAATGAATADVSVARLAVADTELTVVGADGTAAIFSGIDGTLEATALDGPFKGALNLSWVGERRTLRFSTGRMTDRSLRLRAASENEVAASRAEFDGTVSWADGPLTVDGKASASGNAPVALSEGLPNLLWRVQAQVKGTAEKATAEQVEIAVGHTDRQALLSGSAELALAGGLRVNATLATRQVDLDRMLAGEDNRKPPAPEALVRQLLAHAAGSAGGGGAWPFAGSIDVSAGSLLAGGGVIAAPRFVFDAGPRGLRLVRAEGELPGRARLSFLRAREEGGPVSADIRDLQGFAAWFGGAPAPQGPAAAGLVKSMAIDGQLNRTALGFTVSDGDIRGRRDTLHGPA